MISIIKKATHSSNRVNYLRMIAVAAAVSVFVKVLFEILYEYRWYFPANFDASAFLVGRHDTFVGLYRAAFYAHIICGPAAVLLGSLLMISGGRSRFVRMHRRVGRILMLMVLLLVVPSGFVMAFQATAGPLAAVGFATLSLVMASSAAASVYFARTKQFTLHKRWSGRCFLLLCSPLLLRVISGVAIVLQFESDWFYRVNAWVSWLLPLAIYEVWLLRSAIGDFALGASKHSPATEEALP